MLAQNFLPATDLGITEVEKEALITVLGMLERGEIDDDHFRMNTFRKQTECGTVGCLCGWANAVSGGKAFTEIGAFAIGSDIMPIPLTVKDLLNKETRKLFWMGLENWPPKVGSPTAEKGAQVLREYLQTGKSTW